MNMCFLSGKIIGEIDFKFAINNKNIKSIITFKLKLNNDSRILVIGYNEIADVCYAKLKKYDNIYIYGLINSKGQIEIREIYF